jgi:hypothetical protein
MLEKSSKIQKEMFSMFLNNSDWYFKKCFEMSNEIKPLLKIKEFKISFGKALESNGINQT